MAEKFFVSRLPNGITLLAQQMDHVSSATMIIALHSGAAYDPAGAEGASAVATEWYLRGAGDRDTRQLNDALDSLGAHHDESVRSEHLVFSTSQLGRNLADVLGIYADIIRRPSLSDETFEPSRALMMQDLAALEDEPTKKCNMLLREKFYPYPLGRCVYGNADSRQRLTPEAVRSNLSKRITPRGAILGIAGDIDWDAFRGLAE
ncbi:MAG: M16 family metallopeptidase, partial [Planctomycetota bacterium]